MIAWHSGSPKRQLNSITFGPSRVIIRPTKSTPVYGAPSLAIAAIAAARSRAMTRSCIAGSMTGAGE